MTRQNDGTIFHTPGLQFDTSPGDRPDTSAAGVGDSSPSHDVLTDTSPAAAGDVCGWCRAELLATARRDSRYCSQKCRQAAFRIRRRRVIDQANDRPMWMAYADPPYPGLAWMYRDQDSYGGEVDHPALVASLEALYDGYALSTSARALATVLPLFTRPFRVCAWVKPIGVSDKTRGMHNTWEPVIVVPGREIRPGKRDWLAAQPARGGGSTLIGRKPEAFAVWLFDLLGLLPGDTFVDLFPGSGIVSRAWEVWSHHQVSPTDRRVGESSGRLGV